MRVAILRVRRSRHAVYLFLVLAVTIVLASFAVHDHRPHEDDCGEHGCLKTHWVDTVIRAQDAFVEIDSLRDHAADAIDLRSDESILYTIICRRPMPGDVRARWDRFESRHGDTAMNCDRPYHWR